MTQIPLHVSLQFLLVCRSPITKTFSDDENWTKAATKRAAFSVLSGMTRRFANFVYVLPRVESDSLHNFISLTAHFPFHWLLHLAFQFLECLLQALLPFLSAICGPRPRSLHHLRHLSSLFSSNLFWVVLFQFCLVPYPIYPVFPAFAVLGLLIWSPWNVYICHPCPNFCIFIQLSPLLKQFLQKFQQLFFWF